MKEIPILFSTAMVQAILEGRKTQIRRVVKPQPSTEIWDDEVRGSNIEPVIREPMLKNHPELGNGSYSLIDNLHKCPYGKPGDLLWVRESWWKGETWLESDPENTRRETILYRADSKDARPCDVSDEWCINEYGFDKRDWPSWKPSIHLKKEDARIWLEVTDIRVERLQDISAEDIEAEGTPIDLCGFCSGRGFYMSGGDSVDCEYCTCDSYRDSWERLWVSINGKESWDANPWVWVVPFMVLSTTGKPLLNSDKNDEIGVTTGLNGQVDAKYIILKLK